MIYAENHFNKLLISIELHTIIHCLPQKETFLLRFITRNWQSIKPAFRVRAINTKPIQVTESFTLLKSGFYTTMQKNVHTG